MVTVEQYQRNDEIEAQALDALLAIDVGAMEVSPDEAYKISYNPDTLEVSVDCDLTLADFKEMVANPKDWALLTKIAKSLEGKTVAMVGSAKVGGGVAMLRPPLVALGRALGIDMHWYVMDGPKSPETEGVFGVTKLLHNTHQRVPGVRQITDEDKQKHRKWAVEENWAILSQQEPIKKADIMLLDDGQAAPLARCVDPDTVLGFRWHIDSDGELMNDPITPQGEAADWIFDECGVGIRAQFIIAHPVEKFVHPRYADKYYFAPATIDPRDALNEDLTPEQIAEGMEFINQQIAKQNEALATLGRYEDMQPPLGRDPNKPKIIDFTRFCPSKHKELFIQLGVRACQIMRCKLAARGMAAEEIEELLPDIITAGNRAGDDSDGPREFDRTLKDRRLVPPEDREAVRVVVLPHNQRAVNALVHETDALAIMSTAEGCETRCTDARRRGKVVVVPGGNGVHVQVEEGISACVLDYDRPDFDIERGAEFLAELFTNPELRAQAERDVARQYKELGGREFSTTANAIRLFGAFAEQLAEPGRPGHRVWKISEMVAAQEAQARAALGSIAV